jgi:hypothetical protein
MRGRVVVQRGIVASSGTMTVAVVPAMRGVLLLVLALVVRLGLAMDVRDMTFALAD